MKKGDIPRYSKGRIEFYNMVHLVKIMFKFLFPHILSHIHRIWGRGVSHSNLEKLTNEITELSYSDVKNKSDSS